MDATLNQVLARAAELNRPDTGLRYLDRRERETWVSFPDLANRAARVAGGLAALGVKHGDTVAIVMPTRRPESASGRSRSRHVRQHGRRQRASSTRAAAKLRPDDDTDGYIDDIDNGSDDYRQFQQQSRRPASASPRIISASASSSAARSRRPWRPPRPPCGRGW